jgi:DNA-binding SARP family transcriptional activator
MAVVHSLMTGTVASKLAPARLTLTSEFQLLVNSRSIAVPRGVQRLLAFLAISGRPIARSRVAGQLWLDVPEWRALGNLRTALWRLRRVPCRVVRAMDERLSLDPKVQVDVVELTELSSQMLTGPDGAALARLPQLVAAGEILPGWEDEWLVVERERFRERRIQALERACEILMERGDPAGAAQAGLAAIEAEPFRETARRLLIRVHLREGNHAAALRTYLAYRSLVENELGIEPSDLMEELVADVRSHARSRPRGDAGVIRG